MGMEFPDVWCTMEFVATFIQENVSEDQHDEDLTAIQNKLRKLKADVKTLTMLTTDLRRKWELLDMHEHRFHFTQPFLLALRENMLLITGLPQRLTQPEAAVDLVSSRPSSSRQPHLNTHATTSRDPWARNSAPMPDQSYSSSSSEDQEDTVTRLQTPEHAIKNLEKRVVGEGTKIGRFLFQSKEDLCLWYRCRAHRGMGSKQHTSPK
jgi:hypothetical protein